MRVRIAVVLSHPITYFAAQFRSWATRSDVTLRVFYASCSGVAEYHDAEFASTVNWGEQLLQGYDAKLLDENRNSPRPLGFRLDAPGLGDHLEEFRPDVVINYGYAHALQYRVRRWGMRNEVHLAYVSDSENRHTARGRRAAFKRVAVRRFLAPYSTILTVGDANEHYYESLGIPSTRFIRMGFPVDIQSFESAWADRELLRSHTRRRLGISEQEVVVLFVGKMVSRKRPSDLLTACKALQSQAPVRLLLAGSGPDETALRQEADGLGYASSPMLGFVSPTELPALYAASDIYAHPSSMDPHPLAVSEAIYMGLPVIVSSATGSWGPTDDVIEGSNGFAFPTGNVEALQDRLITLAANSDLRRRLGEASRSLAMGYQERAHGGFLDALISRWHSIHASRQEAQD